VRLKETCSFDLVPLVGVEFDQPIRCHHGDLDRFEVFRS